MLKSIFVVVLFYFIVAFIIKVLINVFEEWLPDEMVWADTAYAIFWIVSVPIVIIVGIIVGIGKFADWLAEKIKEMLGW